MSASSPFSLRTEEWLFSLVLEKVTPTAYFRLKRTNTFSNKKTEKLKKRPIIYADGLKIYNEIIYAKQGSYTMEIAQWKNRLDSNDFSMFRTKILHLVRLSTESTNHLLKTVSPEMGVEDLRVLDIPPETTQLFLNILKPRSFSFFGDSFNPSQYELTNLRKLEIRGEIDASDLVLLTTEGSIEEISLVTDFREWPLEQLNVIMKKWSRGLSSLKHLKIKCGNVRTVENLRRRSDVAILLNELENLSSSDEVKEEGISDELKELGFYGRHYFEVTFTIASSSFEKSAKGMIGGKEFEFHEDM